MLTKEDVKEFFVKIEQEAEDDAKKAIALAGKFLRSTYEALAKDPVMLAAIQAGFSGAIAAVSAAVLTGGASVLPAVALAEAKALVIAVGGTAEHELVPIVAGELHAAYAPIAASIPEKVNP